jgi:hypothetical protein
LRGLVGEAVKRVGKSVPGDDGVDFTGTESALVLAIEFG